LRNFLLYTAKIVFFGHTHLQVCITTIYINSCQIFMVMLTLTIYDKVRLAKVGFSTKPHQVFNYFFSFMLQNLTDSTLV
jgi:hypothetical protein